MIPDPYKALNLPHSATMGEIKRAYRDLARQYHPDRLSQATDDELEESTRKFSLISSAYALLMDPIRKAQYDHIYKYGGFDDQDEEDGAPEPRKMPHRGTNQHNVGVAAKSSSRKRKPVGVGYSCTDPYAFLWNSGDVLTTTKIAGLQIPSRFQMGTPAAGFQVSISTGEFRYDGDKRQYTSRTTQFAQGKKSTKTETTTIHSDGRKEVLIQGDNFVEKKTTTVQNMVHEDHLPWYLKTWHAVKDKLEMCYSPQVGAVQ